MIDNLLSVLVSWQIVLVAFVVFIILGLVRTLGTKKDADKKVIGGFAQSRVFQALLPLYPYALAIGLVCIPKAPLPPPITTFVAKILFGIYAGWLSGFSFQIIKSVLEKGFGVQFADKE